MIYPLKLTSPLKDYIWGGTRLKSEWGKKTDLAKVAESWELSCHKDGNSVIQNGEYSGKTLNEYIDLAGKDVLGENGKKFEYFPVLIKLIDAKDNLSVQVHPSNEYALRAEGEYGKTEMWYIVDCDPGASLLYGFQHEITKEEFQRRIENNTLLEVCNKVEVKKGDVFFIDAGTLHAIGSGILIAEIQQNSNTTYRIYDYGRVGVDGKPRELHVEKALDVTKLCPPEKEPRPQGEIIVKAGYTDTLLSACEYFTVHALEIQTNAKLFVDNTSFQSILCLNGDFRLVWENNEIAVTKGESVFLPANFGTYQLVGSGSVITTQV